MMRFITCLQPSIPLPSHPPWCLRPNNSKVMLDWFLSVICRLRAYLQQRRKIIITQEKHVPKFRLAPNFFVLLVKAEQETNESGCCLQNKWIFMDKFPINAFKIKGVHMPGRRIFRPWKTHPSSGEPVPNKLLYPLCLQSKPLERISFLSSK